MIAPRRERPRLLRSVVFRLGALHALLYGLSTLALLALLYGATARYLASQTDAVIEAEIEGLAERYRRDGAAGLIATLRERRARNPASPSVYLLAAPDFGVLAGNLDRWPAAPEDRDGWLEFSLATAPGARVERARARHFVLRGGLHLLIGRNVADLDAVERTIGVATLWGAALTALLALAGAAVMSRSVSRRLEPINRTSRRIMAGRLGERVPGDGSGDELDRLVENLNAMLERIERLMEDVRRVSDSVAHDLRTPLSRLHGRLERLRDGDADPDGRRALVDDAIAESGRLLETFNALLRIARIETDRRRDGFAPVDLAAIVADAADLYEPLAAERRQTLERRLDDRAPLTGDRDLLFQAVANLLDNAVRHAADGGRVAASVAHGPRGVICTVEDDGPGVPEAERERVLERFVRLDASRATPGHGLGLSLVAAVAALHRAELALDDAGPGLRVTLTFPAVDDGGT